jgi:predicted neutral ceramidase superfamily lipid hydrolase
MALFKTDYEKGRLQPTPAGHLQLATYSWPPQGQTTFYWLFSMQRYFCLFIFSFIAFKILKSLFLYFAYFIYKLWSELWGLGFVFVIYNSVVLLLLSFFKFFTNFPFYFFSGDPRIYVCFSWLRLSLIKSLVSQCDCVIHSLFNIPFVFLFIPRLEPRGA